MSVLLDPHTALLAPSLGQHHTGSYYQLLYPGNPQVSLHASVAPSWLKGHCSGGHASGQNGESSPSSAADGPSAPVVEVTVASDTPASALLWPQALEMVCISAVMRDLSPLLS